MKRIFNVLLLTFVTILLFTCNGKNGNSKKQKSLSSVDSFIQSNNLINEWQEKSTLFIQENITNKNVFVKGSFVDLYKTDSTYILVLNDDRTFVGSQVIFVSVPQNTIEYFFNKNQYEDISIALKVTEVRACFQTFNDWEGSGEEIAQFDRITSNRIITGSMIALYK